MYQSSQSADSSIFRKSSPNIHGSSYFSFSFFISFKTYLKLVSTIVDSKILILTNYL